MAQKNRRTSASTSLKKHWFLAGSSIIILFALVLRFYDFPDRWGLAYDQAHDALVARYAVQTGQLPLVGPFSSAGPFQTGGEWYWLIMIPTLLFPNTLVAPWVFITLLYVAFVWLIVRVGANLMGPRGGLIAGLFACVSTAQITQGTNLTNQSPQALLGLLALWTSVLFIQSKKPRFLFWTGFIVSFAATIHLQGAALGAFILALIVFAYPWSFKSGLYMLFGGTLPLVPLIIYDIQRDFVNLNGFVRYYLHGQYAISYEVLGRRWITFVGSFLPEAWGKIVGGSSYIGIALITGVGVLCFIKIYKRSVPRKWLFILVSVGIMVAVLRYTRTPLFDSFYVFIHAPVLLLSAWAVSALYSKNTKLGVLATAIIVASSLKSSAAAIGASENETYIQAAAWRDALVLSYPQEKFALYDRNLITKNKSVPLTLLLDVDGRSSSTGRKVGLFIATQSADLVHPVVVGTFKSYQIVDLASSSSAELTAAGWFPVYSEEIYNATEYWYESQVREN